MQITASTLMALFLTTGGCSAIHHNQDDNTQYKPAFYKEIGKKHYDDYIVLINDSEHKESYRLEVLRDIKSRYGKKTSAEIRDWYRLIDEHKNMADREKLNLVNDFFNQFQWISDSTNWQQQNYWENPIELIISGGGDCEDFALAKYFTLIEMGIPSEKLRMSYVKIKKQHISHMVLEYYSNSLADPLIMDNLTREVARASDRDDLSPVYCLWNSSDAELSVSTWQHHELETWPGKNKKAAL